VPVVAAAPELRGRDRVVLTEIVQQVLWFLPSGFVLSRCEAVSRSWRVQAEAVAARWRVVDLQPCDVTAAGLAHVGACCKQMHALLLGRVGRIAAPASLRSCLQQLKFALPTLTEVKIYQRVIILQDILGPARTCRLDASAESANVNLAAQDAAAAAPAAAAAAAVVKNYTNIMPAILAQRATIQGHYDDRGLVSDEQIYAAATIAHACRRLALTDTSVPVQAMALVKLATSDPSRRRHLLLRRPVSGRRPARVPARVGGEHSVFYIGGATDAAAHGSGGSSGKAGAGGCVGASVDSSASSSATASAAGGSNSGSGGGGGGGGGGSGSGGVPQVAQLLRQTSVESPRPGDPQTAQAAVAAAFPTAARRGSHLTGICEPSRGYLEINLERLALAAVFAAAKSQSYFVPFQTIVNDHLWSTRDWFTQGAGPGDPMVPPVQADDEEEDLLFYAVPLIGGGGGGGGSGGGGGGDGAKGGDGGGSCSSSSPAADATTASRQVSRAPSFRSASVSSQVTDADGAAAGGDGGGSAAGGGGAGDGAPSMLSAANFPPHPVLRQCSGSTPQEPVPPVPASSSSSSSSSSAAAAAAAAASAPPAPPPGALSLGGPAAAPAPAAPASGSIVNWYNDYWLPLMEEPMHESSNL
jgi:hypothetical protein